MRRLSRPSRTTKVGFLGIEEDFPPTSARSTIEAAFDEDSHPSTAGHQPVDSQESAQEAIESNPTKKNAGGKTEPWNIAKTEPNITEFALPSSKPNRNRIILWHVSNVLIGILCVGCSATQYFAFAELMHELNIHKEDQNFRDKNLTNQNSTDKNYGTSRATNGEITENKILFVILLIPEFYTFIYCLYFAIFKRPFFPKKLQILVTVVTEMLYAAGMGFYIFYLAHDLTRTMNVALLMFPTIIPLVFSEFQDTTIGDAEAQIPDENQRITNDDNQNQLQEKGESSVHNCARSTLKAMSTVARIGKWLFFIAGMALIFLDSDFILKNFYCIICVNLMSIPNYMNFSICPKYDCISAIHSVGRGIPRKRNDTESAKSKKKRDPELSIIISHLFATPVKCCILALIFLSTDEYVDPTQDSFRVWMMIFAIFTVSTSYLQKVSVKLGLQKSGLALSGLLGPLIALSLVFYEDLPPAELQFLNDYPENYYGTEWRSNITSFYQRTSDRSNDPSDDKLIMCFVTGILGILHLLCLTQYVWKPKNFIYPLDRHVFMLPAFRPIGTSTFSLLNRRSVDIIEEQESEVFNTQFSGSKTTTRKSTVQGRKTNKSGMWSKGQKNPYIFICTTLWHEEDFEMATLLRSVVKLLRHARIKKNDPNQENQYELEMHIFFDNVFVKKPKDKEKGETDDFIHAKEWLELNEWVVQFQTVFKDVLSKYEDNEHITPAALEQGKIIRTPYGGRVIYRIAGYDFVIHLKDAELVQRGKRWSQVMYLYYLIGWKIDACELRDSDGFKVKKSKSFVLALDGDVDFEPDAFELVLDRCMRNEKLAACCGAIHPTGSGWLVAYQNFEYAVGHWLQKAAEHVLGCVLCSPGCFSLMRVSYLSEPNVMAMYKSLALNPMEKLQYDQGEDRWLCTLMLFAGGRIEYEGSSHCNTFAPEDLPTFYKQRRRWGPSTTANIWNLVAQQKLARRSNPYISVPYILYQFTVMTFALIGVSTTMMMVAEAFSLGVGNSIPRWACYLIVILPVAIFTMACYLSKDGDFQIQLATWFSLAFSFLMALVFIGIFIEGITCPFSPSFLFFVSMAGIHILAAILHWDFYALLCGVVYFLFIPSCFIFLQIYSIANLNDCSWGTRQAASTDKKAEKTFWQRVMGKSEEQIRKEAEEGEDGTNCACLICMDSYNISSREQKAKKGLLQNDTESIPMIEQPKTKAKREESEEEKRIAKLKEERKKTGTLRRVKTPPRYSHVQQEEEMENDGLKSKVVPEDIQFSNNVKSRKSMHQSKVGDETVIEAAQDKIFLRNITKERFFGGYSIKKLRLEDQENWSNFMNNPHVAADCFEKRAPRGEVKKWKLEDVRDREIKLYKKFGTKYLSWVIGAGSPFNKNCKVYTLSNPEQEFWERMQDPTDGFIGIKKNGRNGKIISKHEEKLAEEMTKFKDEKFLYFIFINILWIIVSCTILKYSYLLGHIDIDITGNEKFHSCGLKIEDEDKPPCNANCNDCYKPSRNQLVKDGNDVCEPCCNDVEKFVYRLQDRYRPEIF